MGIDRFILPAIRAGEPAMVEVALTAPAMGPPK
jgi:hypothetical protein